MSRDECAAATSRLFTQTPPCECCGTIPCQKSNTPDSTPIEAKIGSTTPNEREERHSAAQDRCDKCGAPKPQWATVPCVKSLTQSPRHTITRFHIPIPEADRANA